ncbi:MAG: quinolinate synthase NadA [Deltaproteobacteria bacterium]|jgi:quinolinate synthase|nr:quinolinate synthase NadA [Deltaproteobacteria bacterium]
MKSERKRNQARRIIELREILGAEILSHFYQRADVKALSDLVGGSRAVLRRAAVSPARALVVCGVDFMVRAVARLRPDIPVVYPRPDAVCPMSAKAGPETALAARRAFPCRRLAAGMKARADVAELCDADHSLDAAEDASLDLPLEGAPGSAGTGLGAGVSGSFTLRLVDTGPSSRQGLSSCQGPSVRQGLSSSQGPSVRQGLSCRQVPSSLQSQSFRQGSSVRLGPPSRQGPSDRDTAVLPLLDLEPSGIPGRLAYGDLAPVCAIHDQVEAAEVSRLREEFPAAVFGANSMCSPEVKAMCDFCGDADALARTVATSGAPEFLLFCEAGLSETLAQAFPAKIFRETETEMFCPSMKLTNVKDVLRALEGLVPAAMPDGMDAGLPSGLGPALPGAAGARALRAAMEALEAMDAARGSFGTGGGTP